MNYSAAWGCGYERARDGAAGGILTGMPNRPVIKVLSVHWGFGPGGVANYAAQLESVCRDGTIDIRSLVFINRKRHVDRENLQRLKNRGVVEYGRGTGFGWLKRLRAELNGYGPQLVVSHGFNGHFIVFIARLLGWLRAVPVATYHGPYHPMSLQGVVKKQLFERFTNYYLRRHASAIAAVAAHEARALESRGVDRSRITVIHNGIADVVAPAGSRERLRSEWGVAADIPLIGVVSRLELVKGVADAIEAMAHVVRECPTVHMLIIGSGTREEELRSLAVARGLEQRVTFAGFRSDVVACLTAIDIYLLPSHSECHSIGLLEAMRAARPIVVTAVGGNVETVTPGMEALLVPAAAPRAMADALVALLRGRERAEALGIAARNRYLADFTAAEATQKTAQWLRRCVEGL